MTRSLWERAVTNGRRSLTASTHSAEHYAASSRQAMEEVTISSTPRPIPNRRSRTSRQKLISWKERLGVAQRRVGLFIRSSTYGTMRVMGYPGKQRDHDSANGAVSGSYPGKDTSADPINPRAFGLVKAAYAVGETLDLLNIGRTSLYAAVKRGDLKHVKFGKKTFFSPPTLPSFWHG
jgi:hypothetical protein